MLKSAWPRRFNHEQCFLHVLHLAYRLCGLGPTRMLWPAMVQWLISSGCTVGVEPFHDTLLELAVATLDTVTGDAGDGGDTAGCMTLADDEAVDAAIVDVPVPRGPSGA